jgi:hypothetical protein
MSDTRSLPELLVEATQRVNTAKSRRTFIYGGLSHEVSAAIANHPDLTTADVITLVNRAIKRFGFDRGVRQLGDLLYEVSARAELLPVFDHLIQTQDEYQLSWAVELQAPGSLRLINAKIGQHLHDLLVESVFGVTMAAAGTAEGLELLVRLLANTSPTIRLMANRILEADVAHGRCTVTDARVEILRRLADAEVVADAREHLVRALGSVNGPPVRTPVDVGAGSTPYTRRARVEAAGKIARFTP